GVRSVPGVEVALHVERSGAPYQKPTEGIGIVAVSPEDDWPSAFTYPIAPEYLAAFRKSRTAMLIRDTVTEKYGWKIGDHIPLIMTTTPQKNDSTNWAFDVVRTYTDSDDGVGRGRFVLISIPYFDEARA